MKPRLRMSHLHVTTRRQSEQNTLNRMETQHEPFIHTATKDDHLLKIAGELGRLGDLRDSLRIKVDRELDPAIKATLKEQLGKARDDLHRTCAEWRAAKAALNDRRNHHRPPVSTENRERDRDQPPMEVRPPIGHTAIRITPGDMNPPPRKPYISNVHEKGACLAVPLMCNGCNVATTYLYEINMHAEPHASTRGTWSPTYMFDPTYMVCSTCKRGPKRD